MGRERLVGEPGRLDAVVARQTGVARGQVQRAILAGRVLVDGIVRSKSFRLVGGETIDAELSLRDEIPSEGPPLPIRFADEHLLVIAKPAGLVTHPTARRRTSTVVNRLKGMGAPLSTLGGSLRPGIVHRLDVGTSGLLVIAKDDEVHAALTRLFRTHDIDRRYLALVRGRVGHHAFTVEAPVGRRAARVVVDEAEGRPAETALRVRELLRGATLLEASPKTGRTHQIRVHLSAIGHPILGDRAYGGVGEDSRRLELTRPFLHAWRLAFDEPLTGERIDLEEPLPDDLVEALERARAA